MTPQNWKPVYLIHQDGRETLTKYRAYSIDHAMELAAMDGYRCKPYGPLTRETANEYEVQVEGKKK